jgi:hypothetical protein
MYYSLMVFNAVVSYWCVMRCIGIPEGTPFRKLCWGDKLAIVILCWMALYVLYFIFIKVHHG